MIDSYSSTFIKKKIQEFQKGEEQKAFLELKSFVSKNIKDINANYNLGVMADALNLIDEAKKYYLETLELDKKNWQAIFNLYILYIKEKNYIEALPLINLVLAIKKDYQPALRDKALVLNYLNKPDEALKYIQKSIKLNEIDYIASNILGLIFLNMKLYDKAIPEFEKSIRINSSYISSYNNLSTCYSKKFDFESTERILLKALLINPEQLETINNIANVYSQKGEYDKAIDYYKKALKKSKDKSDILYNIGVAYFYKKDFKVGETFYKKAYELDPNNDVLKKNYSLLLLAQQKYKEGWSFYDGRLNSNDFLFKNSTLHNVKQKLWVNQKLKNSDKILVIKEQGIGDEILFSSMYPDFLKKFPNCLIETEKRLLELFKYSFGNEKKFIEYRSISRNKKELDKFDYTIYAGSLGKLFRNDINDFPTKSFLKNPINQVDRLKLIFEKFNDKKKIGISWTSKSLLGEDKSLTLEQIKPILKHDNNISFFNMQYYNSSQEIINFENKNKNIKINNFENVDMYNDFYLLASILKKLDLFITVSNSTAHLAAALGVETWIIKPKNHAVFHYWNQPNNKTPWYDCVKLYEYNKNWDNTILNINKDFIKKFI